MMAQITKIRVVTRNFIADFIASIKNVFGGRISQYENMVNDAQKSMWNELDDEGIKLKWWRIEISQLTNGALVIMLYGDSL